MSKTGVDYLGSLKMSLSYDTRDNKLNTHKGVYSNVYIEPFFGHASYLKFFSKVSTEPILKVKCGPCSAGFEKLPYCGPL